MNTETVYCNRCKKSLLQSDFNIKKNGELAKACNACKTARIKTKCEHNEYRYRCKACGGTSICIHQKLRSRCKTCKTIKDDKKIQT
jgi:hypothetical protein